MWAELLIGGAVFGVLMLCVVAWYHSRWENLQEECQDSLDNLRRHHDQLMRQTQKIHAKKVESATCELVEKLQAQQVAAETAQEELALKADHIEKLKSAMTKVEAELAASTKLRWETADRLNDVEAKYKNLSEVVRHASDILGRSEEIATNAAGDDTA